MPGHRLRCYSCRATWIVRPVQILRYRRYEAAVVGSVFEARGAGRSWGLLDEQFPGVSLSTQRGWVNGLLRGLPDLLSKLGSWSADKIDGWIPPSNLSNGGLPALLSLVASLQEWKVCGTAWLEYLQNWVYREGSGHLISATKWCGGRDP